MTTTRTERVDAMPPANHERRLAYRFLTLPFRHQIAITDSLSVLTDEDRALSDDALFRKLFKCAAASGRLAKLWDETEKRHADPADFNPFEREHTLRSLLILAAAELARHQFGPDSPACLLCGGEIGCDVGRSCPQARDYDLLRRIIAALEAAP